MSALADVIRSKKILVCVGSGGVGKTTTAASLALAGARAGRRTLVLTIDPARRLATALGLEGFGHDARRVADEHVERGQGGELFAMMLDQKHAFDELVHRYVTDPAARERIFSNRIYRQVSATLAGSHEYAAMLRLSELAERGDYDLLVLDTPPTTNALDFLDAPERLSAAIDSPVIGWLLKTRSAESRFSLQSLGMGAAFVVKRLGRFVGSEFLADVAEFLAEFQVIIGGFRAQATQVYQILRSPDVAFVMISSAEQMSVDESLYFHHRLAASGMPVGGFVVNRVHPEGPPAPGRAELVERLDELPEVAPLSPAERIALAADLDRAYQDFQRLAHLDTVQIARLREAAGDDVPLVRVPLLSHDVVDIAGLEQMISHLTA